MLCQVDISELICVIKVGIGELICVMSKLILVS